MARGLSATEAVRQAGYAESTVQKKAYQIVQRPLVQSALTDALERQGLTMEKLMKVYLDALEANHVVKSSERLEAVETEVPDTRTRVDAADRVSRFYGAIPTQVEMPAPPSPGLTVIISRSDPNQPRPEPKDITPPSGQGQLDVKITRRGDNGDGRG